MTLADMGRHNAASEPFDLFRSWDTFLLIHKEEIKEGDNGQVKNNLKPDFTFYIFPLVFDREWSQNP